MNIEAFNRYKLRSIALLVSFLVFALLVSPRITCAQKLWDSTTYGMSPEKVLKAVPGTKPVSDGATLNDGAKELIRLDYIEIVNSPFQAKFYFQKKKLVQVTLTLKVDKDKPSQESISSVVDRLITALRSKYGKEITHEDTNTSIAKTYRATWISGKMNILLFAVQLFKQPPTVNVSYQTRVSKQASKL